MGTPHFAVAALRACLQLGDVVGVVTQPDKPKGRGQSVEFSPVKVAALESGLSVLQPQKVKTPEFLHDVVSLDADVAVVTAYGRILPKAVLDAPRHGCVNIHASLLPRFRGAAPIQWAIAHGDEKSGVCLMKMDEGMDTGALIDVEELTLSAQETSATLHERLASLGAALLQRSLIPYLQGQRALQPQPSEGVMMAPMIRKEDGRLDFSKPAQVLERRIRAFVPWPGAFFEIDAQVVKVHQAHVVDAQGKPGVVMQADAKGILIATAENALLLTSVQPVGKRVMRADEFLNGNRLEAGTVLQVVP
jgi:methionyl-tRNA formyltransferase